MHPRSTDWLKFKNPAALAVKREAEGGLDWGRYIGWGTIWASKDDSL